MPGIWVVFSLSFVLSLSGAVMPGPLLTYTISRTLQTSRTGWLTGARVISGHAALEALLVLGLALGVGSLLQAPLALKIITAIGSALLVLMGTSLLRETFRGAGSAAATAEAVSAAAGGAGGDGPGATGYRGDTNATGYRGGTSSTDYRGDTNATDYRGGIALQLPPVLAGILVSASNPYWWVWWVTIGAAFLIRYDITFQKWPALLAFFIGHELGDLGWFSAVSIVLSLGKNRIPPAVLTGIQVFCGIAIIGFGGWLALSTFILH